MDLVNCGNWKKGDFFKMSKKLLVCLVLGVLLFGAFTLIDLDNKENIEYEFNICQEQPLFGLKYTNCHSIECINFYENIKIKIKEDCK